MNFACAYVIVICAEFAWWTDAGRIADHVSNVVLLEHTRQQVCAGSPREDGYVFTGMCLVVKVEWREVAVPGKNHRGILEQTVAIVHYSTKRVTCATHLSDIHVPLQVFFTVSH